MMYYYILKIYCLQEKSGGNIGMESCIESLSKEVLAWEKNCSALYLMVGWVF